MLKFVILLAIVTCACAAATQAGLEPTPPHLDGRIVGGKNASISSYPWQISLQRNTTNRHICGGSIYNNSIIVTAAHCVDGEIASKLQIRAGSSYTSSEGVVITVAAYKVHENFNRTTLFNDVAILRLKTPLSYNATIRNITLATKAPKNNSTAVVSGWGALRSGGNGPTILQSVDVAILARRRCVSSKYGYNRQSVQKTMICAAAPGKDACQGDSGGPLVSGGALVGIVSWGYGCAEPQYPGVYTDVAAFHSWIVAATKVV